MGLPRSLVERAARQNRLAWTILIAASILLASAAVGWLSFALPLRYVLLLLVGVGFVVIALLNMRRALTLTVFAAALVPFSLGTGTASQVNAAMVLIAVLAGVWIIRMLLEGRLHLVPSPVNAPLIGFIAAAAVSWLATTVVSAGSVRLPANIMMVQAGQFAIFVLTAAAFFLTANHRLPERTLKLWVIFIIAAGFGIMAFQATLGWKRSVAGWSGVLYVWPVVLLTSQLLFNETLTRWQKVLGVCALILWMYWSLGITIDWKSGWVPSLLGILLLLLLKSWRWFVLALVVLVSIVLALGPTTVADALLATEQSSATPVRWNLWFDVFRLGGKSPLFGLGPATYTYYWKDLSFESWSYLYVDPYAFRREIYAPPAHNMYADVFAQTGAVGLILLLGAVAGGLVLGVRGTRRSHTPFRQAYARGVLCGFAALAVSSFLLAEWLLPFVYNLGLAGFSHSVYSWLLLGTLVGIGQADGSGDGAG